MAALCPLIFILLVITNLSLLCSETYKSCVYNISVRFFRRMEVCKNATVKEMESCAGHENIRRLLPECSLHISTRFHEVNDLVSALLSTCFGIQPYTIKTLVLLGVLCIAITPYPSIMTHDALPYCRGFKNYALLIH